MSEWVIMSVNYLLYCTNNINLYFEVIRFFRIAVSK